jgi:hypothetical protein
MLDQLARENLASFDLPPNSWTGESGKILGQALGC